MSALRKLDGLKDLDADLTRVHDLEHEADTLSRAAVARLFHEGTDPLYVIKWQDLYRELENAIDAAEDAGRRSSGCFTKRPDDRSGVSSPVKATTARSRHRRARASATHRRPESAFLREE